MKIHQQQHTEYIYDKKNTLLSALEVLLPMETKFLRLEIMLETL